MQTVRNCLAGIGGGVLIGVAVWLVLRTVDFSDSQWVDAWIVLSGAGAVIGALIALVLTVVAGRQKPVYPAAPVAERQEAAAAREPSTSFPAEEPAAEKEEYGFLARSVAGIFGYLQWLSIPELVAWRWPNKSRRWSARLGEVYVLSFFAVEIGALAVLFGWPWIGAYQAFFLFAYIVLGIRLLGLWQAAFNTSVFANVRKKARGEAIASVAAPDRTLILTLVNFVEVVAIFAVFAFLNQAAFGLESTWSAVAYSVQVATLLGANSVDAVSGIAGRVLFLSELGMAVMFILFVFAAAVSWLPKRG